MKIFHASAAIAYCLALSTPVIAADLYVYPKAGQDKEQQDRDTYECMRWATEQTLV
jgi:hypothetical protein